MAKFFEVTSVSATHIYHSALELSPPSSIVRRLYHHQRIPSSPRLAIGIPSSWSQSVAIPNKDYSYRSCAWSPCGRFIATQTHEAVEVRDPLTSELFSSFRPANHTSKLMGSLAYSSDGRSLCCASDTSIVIWDIQTGGVAREVAYDDTLNSTPKSLVWSPDGRTIGAVFGRYPYPHSLWAVVAYDVASGRILSRGTLDLVTGEPYLWHDESFWIMVASSQDGMLGGPHRVDILKLGPTLTRVRSLSIPTLGERWTTESRWYFQVESFSPISHHVSVSLSMKNGGRFLVLDVQNPVAHLLDKNGVSDIHCFSSDGKLFAASLRGDIHVWSCTSPCYTLWRRFPDQGWSSNGVRPRFSPTSSSILGHFGGVLQILYLDDHSSPRIATSEPYILVPPHASYIVTAHPRESTVTITNHISHTPPQFIDAGTTILGFALTGNVLLVAGSDTIVAWRITERGAVDGVFDGRMAGPGDSIWTVSPEWSFTSSCWGSAPPEFPIITQTGSIALDRILIHIYHSGTGEGPEHIPEPSQPPDLWYNLEVTSRGRYYLRCHELSQFNDTSEDNRPTPRTAFREGWVKDPEGKHRLWLPVERRMAEGCAKLFYYFATLHPELPGDLNVAMF